MKGKRGAGAMNWWPVAIIVVAAMLVFYPQLSKLFPQAPAGGTGGTGGTTGGDTTVCPVESTTLTYSAKDVHASGTSLGINARLWVQGNPMGVINTSGQNTVSPGDKLNVWFGADDATYYGQLVNGAAAVPCKGTYTVPGSLWVKDTGVVVTTFDEFGERQTGAANNQTIGPGETKQMKFLVQGNFHKYFGNPDVKDMDNVAVFEYKQADLNSVKVTKDGVELAATAIPGSVQASDTGNKLVAYTFPKIAGSANVEYFLIVQADDIVNPSFDVVLTIKDVDYFYDDNLAKISKGVADENDNEIGVAALSEPTATFYLS